MKVFRDDVRGYYWRFISDEEMLRGDHMRLLRNWVVTDYNGNPLRECNEYQISV